MESELHTFDEIYVLDLHGNSKKKEKCLDASKDENVFVIQQVTAIILMLKVDAASCRIIKREEGVSTFGNPDLATPKVLHHEISGLRQMIYLMSSKSSCQIRRSTYTGLASRFLSPSERFRTRIKTQSSSINPASGQTPLVPAAARGQSSAQKD